MGRRLGKIANEKFERLSTSFTNAEILRDLVKRVYLRESVFTRLLSIEESGKNIKWWEDEELMNIFKNMYFAGVLLLPYNPVERLRWIALICSSVCEWKKHKNVNLLTDTDLLPVGDVLADKSLVLKKEILDIRSELAKNGWDYVFNWNGKHGN